MLWLTENLWNLAVGGCVVLIAALCVGSLLPGKRKGGCGGCPHAGSCPHSSGKQKR